MRIICSVCPTNNTLLINFRLISDAEIFAYEHRLSMQVGDKCAKKKNVSPTCVHIPTDLPFLHTTVGGWVCVSPSSPPHLHTTNPTENPACLLEVTFICRSSADSTRDR